MDRRDFLQAAGLGSIGLAFPTLASAAWAQSADDAMNFHFVAASAAGMVAGVEHVVVGTGQGQFDGSQVSGGGTFTHFDNAPPGTPKPLIAAGTWRARQLVSWDLAGVYANGLGGILEMRVDVLRETPSPAIIPGTLRIVCNFGPGGIQTGEDEGFVLTVAGLPPFRAMVPPLGVTLFTSSVLPGLGAGGGGARLPAPAQVPSR